MCIPEKHTCIFKRIEISKNVTTILQIKNKIIQDGGEVLHNLKILLMEPNGLVSK